MELTTDSPLEACTQRLDSYQSRLVEDLRQCIGRNWLRKKPSLCILDAGCDISGLQVQSLRQLTRGEVVGINVHRGFPSDRAVATAGLGTTLLQMDGTAMQFPNESFDLVVSANVLEHVANVRAYLMECARVLRPRGLAYIEAAPVWTSARGHHIHEDMVAENCPSETGYRNNGTVIPDWSHLELDEAEMRSVIEPSLEPTTCDYILSYLYRSRDLNKKPWRLIKNELESAFVEVEIHTWDVHEPNKRNRPRASVEDHDVFGFVAIGRKRKQNGVVRRLAWRLRRLGL